MCVELESCPESSSGEAMITDYSVNPTIGTYYTIFEFKISYSVIKDAGSGDMQLTITPPTDKNPIGKQNKKKRKKKEKVFYNYIYNLCMFHKYSGYNFINQYCSRKLYGFI